MRWSLCPSVDCYSLFLDIVIQTLKLRNKEIVLFRYVRGVIVILWYKYGNWSYLEDQIPFVGKAALLLKLEIEIYCESYLKKLPKL